MTGQSPLWRQQEADDGIVVLTLEVPGQSQNTLDEQVGEELLAALAQLQRRPETRGLVLSSAKEDSFIAGADIRMLDRCDGEEARRLSQQAQRVCAELEALPFPVAAAIHGACLGGGLELALACQWRIVSDDSRTRLGLPEVKLGLLPGSGGTQRLPRLIGLRGALELALTGRSLRSQQALTLGLVDDVVPRSILLQSACAALGRPSGRRRLPLRRLPETVPWGRALMVWLAARRVRRQSGGHYPAPAKILEAMRCGLDHGMAAGLAREAACFGELVMTPQSRALRRLFLASNALKKAADSAEPPARPIRRVGVLGGGMMGGGIAYVTAVKGGRPVRIKEIAQEGISSALRFTYERLNQQVERGRLRAPERDRQLSRITGALDYSGMQQVELVVEAVFEQLSLKRQMVQEVDAHLPERVVLASNTSSLSIADIAAAAARPQQVIGLHYFSPVDRMPLVEVIPHAGTSAQTVATTLAFARGQGKIPILVRDRAGFYVNRILAPYLNEAVRILAEGVPLSDIDKALVGVGFPVGPFTLLDEVGIDVAAGIAPVLARQWGERFTPPALLTRLVEEQRLGRKAGRGFYTYGGRGKKADRAVYRLLGVKPKARLPAEEIARRCLLPMLNEATRCLQERVVACARDGDMGAVFGIGFPPFLGGPFWYMDQQGAGAIIEQMEQYAARYGNVLLPAAPLRQLAAVDGLFGDPPPAWYAES